MPEVKVVLTPTQTTALVTANVPFDPNQTSLTAEQLKALETAGLKWFAPVAKP